jgi:hypothetical protein
MSSSPKILVQRLLAVAQMPRYAHVGAYGDLAADLFAAEAATLAPVGEPGSTVAVRTGLAMELPSTHGALVEDRSGLAVRGITTLAGVIDPGYRGELKIVLTRAIWFLRPSAVKAGLVRRDVEEFVSTGIVNRLLAESGCKTFKIFTKDI